MDCKNCEIYQETDGIGKLECKKCRKYKVFQMQNTPRSKLIFEDLTELIKEACATEERTVDIIDHIRRMPPELSVPLMMYYALNLSLRDIAAYHRFSKSKVHNLIKKSVTILKAMLAV